MYTGDYENQLQMVMGLSEKFQMEKEQEYIVVEGQNKEDERVYPLRGAVTTGVYTDVTIK